MILRRALLLPVLLACGSTPALAQQAVDAVPTAGVTPAFDPARVAMARPVVARLFPDGTYKRIMGEAMSKMMDGIMDSALQVPMGDIARIANLPADQVAAMDKAKLGEITQIIDPYFRERMSRGMTAMFAEMGDLFTGLEPKMREGLARAYARKFDERQLADLNAFFTTPTGSLYAGESMMIFMDPEVMKEMQGAMPEIMREMPRMVKAMEEATKDLPPARKAKDLTKAEKEKIAQLLGEES